MIKFNTIIQFFFNKILHQQIKQINKSATLTDNRRSSVKMNDYEDKLSISSSGSIASSNTIGTSLPASFGNNEDSSAAKSIGQSQVSSDKYNLSNVLKHIYTLKYGQKSSGSSQAPSNTHQTQSNDQSKQFWMPDDQVKECFECNDKFTTFRRRHVKIFSHFFCF